MKKKVKRSIVYLIFLLLGGVAFTADTSTGGISSDVPAIIGNKSIINQELSIVNSNSIFNNDVPNIIASEEEKQIISHTDEKVIINSDNTIISSDFDGIGVYVNPYQNVFASPISSVVQPYTIDYEIDPYINGYGKYIEIVTSINPKEKEKFVSYFTDWAKTTEGKDFYSYTTDRATAELVIENCYAMAIEKFGVGTAIIAVPIVISYFVPGGSILSTSLIVIAKASSKMALFGGLSGASLAATVSFLENDSIDKVVYKSISGGADGFLIGAITGIVSGTWSSIKNFSDAICLDNKIVNLKSNYVFDKKGNLLGKAIRMEGADNIDDLYYIKKGSSSVFNKDDVKVADIAKYDGSNGANYVLYNERGVLGYLDNHGKLISYGYSFYDDAISSFSDHIYFGNKTVDLKSNFVFDHDGNLIGKAIRAESTGNVDDLYYIKQGSASVFDKNDVKVADIAKYNSEAGSNYVLYNERGRILGYLDDQYQLVSYGDPSSAALIKNQNRIQPGIATKLQVQENAKLLGQYNSETGRYIDALTGEEIIGTPEMGHVYGSEYTNELQRAYMNGMSESAFRKAMQDPTIYQLQSMSSNRSHGFEASRITIDDFPEVEKSIGDELWKNLSTQ